MRLRAPPTVARTATAELRADEEPVEQPEALLPNSLLVHLLAEEDAGEPVWPGDWWDVTGAIAPIPEAAAGEPLAAGEAAVEGAVEEAPPAEEAAPVEPEAIEEEPAGEPEKQAPVVEPVHEAEAEEPGAPEAAPEEPAAAEEEPAPEPAPAPEAAAELEAWTATVRQETQARVRPPPAPDAAEAAAPVRNVRTRVAGREAARRRGATEDVRKSIPDAPELPEGLPPPPPLPVPEAEAAVVGAVGKELPPQTMPTLQSYTHTRAGGDTKLFRSVVAARLPPSAGVTLAPAPPPPAEPGVEGADAVKKVKKAGATVREGVQGTGALVLGTAPRPGAPGARPSPPMAKADVARVLVRLRGTIRTDAGDIVDGVRRGLYPRGMLQDKLPALGAELAGGLETDIGSALDTIAATAGVAAADLDRAASEATGTVVAQHGKTRAELDAEQAQTGADVEREGKDSANTIAGARDAAEDAIDEKTAAAEGGASPDAIRARRDRLMERVNRRLAPEDIRYEREGADRLRALDVLQTGYIGGYRLLVDQVADQIRSDEAAEAARAARAAGRAPATVPPATQTQAPAPAPAPAVPPIPIPFVPAATTPPTPAERWGMDRINEVRAAFTELRNQVNTATTSYRGGITAARDSARAYIRAWADRQIADRSSWWERLWDRIKSWRREAEDQTRAWEEARNAMLAADLQGDMAFVADLSSGARSEQEMRALAAVGGLSDAQKAIVEAYFAGPEARNPIAAIAAGMRVRIGEVHRARLKEEIDRQLYALPPAQWDPVAKVAEAEGGNVVIVERGNRFHASVDQWGTDEDKLFAALVGLTKLQRHALDLWYQHNHDTTIDEELRDELEDAELDRAQALMRGDELAAEAAALNDAIAGAGTNEAEIWRALRNKTPEQRRRIEEIYLEKYGETLQSALEGDLSGDELRRGEALREGNVARADAIALHAAQTGKWYGGADTDEIQAIYAQNRAELELEAQQEGWTSERLHQELLARNQQIDAEHGQVYRTESGDPGPGLQASFREHLRGPELDLALGLATLDMARADAARLELERREFTTDDDDVNAILESQYTRARTEVSLDLEYDLRQRRELAILRGEHWDPVRERAAMRGKLDDLAQQRSQGYMRDLESRYDSTYSRWGRGGLQTLIAMNMSGPDRRKARDLVAQGGRLYPEQEVLYAVEGVGTDTDALRALLKDKSPEEIRKLEAAWAARYPKQPPLRSRIMEEVSGRDEFDLGFMLEGAPRTPQERLDLAKRRLEYEQSAYALGGMFSDNEREMLELEVAKLEQTVKELETAPEGSERAANLQWELDQRDRAVESSIEEHRRSVDALADTAAMVAAIAAAVLVTVLTWGAGAVVIGAMAATAAASATITTKALLKGSAYSEEELLVDVVSGVVDVAAAVLTAGVGTALLKAAHGIPIGPLAKLATSSSTTKRVIAHGLAEGVEGMISSVPSAAAGAFVDENTWRRGDPLSNIGMAVGMGAGMGTLLSGGLGSLGGRAKPGAPGAPRLDAGNPPDLDAAARYADTGAPPPPVDAAGRSAQWQAHRAANPEASYDDFLRDLEAGRVAPDASAPQRFQQAVSAQLVSGVPPGQRALLEGVPVHVLSDAEFERLTRSAKGQAVTIIEGGRPRILMRESADVRVLREEGIHAVQALDRRTAHAAAMLDEAHMARWDSLPLQTKIDMYRAKLDLEIDAHVQLATSLRRSLDDTPPGAALAELRDHLDEATRNLRMLSDRRVELEGFGPLDRLRAQFNRGPLAARLDQPPRLFTKKEPPPMPTPEPKTPPGHRVKRLDPDRAEIDAMKTNPDPNLRRQLKAAERSPQQDVGDVERIGNNWRETSLRGTPPKKGRDLYRIVEVRPKDGSPPYRIEETVVRGSDPPKWVKRGREATEAGEAAEEASLVATQRKIARADEAETIVTLGREHQNLSGQGFDEVYFHFKKDGSVELVLVEVKNYPDDWVPFEDFTAVTANLKKNLQSLARLVTTTPPPAALAGLSAEQLDALQRRVTQALSDRKAVTLEVRLGPDTYIGEKRVAGGGKPTLRKLRERFPNVRVEHLGEELAGAAEAAVESAVPKPQRARFIAVVESLAKAKLVDLPLSPVTGKRGVFRDQAGRVVTLRSVTTEQVGRGSNVDREALDRIARETVEDLQKQVAVPGVGNRGLQVVLDLGMLDPETRDTLLRAIGRKLDRIGRRSELAPSLVVGR